MTSLIKALKLLSMRLFVEKKPAAGTPTDTDKPNDGQTGDTTSPQTGDDSNNRSLDGVDVGCGRCPDRHSRLPPPEEIQQINPYTMRPVTFFHGAHSLCMHRRKPAVLFSMLSYRSMSWVLRFGFCVLPSACNRLS